MEWGLRSGPVSEREMAGTLGESLGSALEALSGPVMEPASALESDSMREVKWVQRLGAVSVQGTAKTSALQAKTEQTRGS